MNHRGMSRRQRRRYDRMFAARLGRQPVEQMDPAAIFEELVEDGCKRRLPPLFRMLLMIDALSLAWGKTPEQVFDQVNGEVRARCGWSLPLVGHSPQEVIGR